MEIKIMVGCSGSGKSTYINTHWPRAKVVSSDHFFMVDGEYRFDPTKLGQSHGACLRNYIYAIQQGMAPDGFDGVLAVDNTNTTMQELAPYCAIAASYGIPFEVVVLDVPPAVAAPRNAHGVPERGVERQYSRMQGMLKNLPSHWPVKWVSNG